MTSEPTSHGHRNAAIVEIAYAVLSFAVLVALAAGGILLVGWGFHLHGTEWDIAGKLAFGIACVAAGIRSLAMLLWARRRGV